MIPSSDNSSGLLSAVARRAVDLAGGPTQACRQFCRLAWPGAAIGLIIGALLLPAYGGYCAGTGLGTAVDVVVCVFAGAIVFVVASLLLVIVLAAFRLMPLRFVAVFLTATGLLVAMGSTIGLSPVFAVRLGGPPVALIAIAGAGVSLLLRRSPGRTGVILAVIACLMLIVAVAGMVSFISWLANSGRDPFLADIHAAAGDFTRQLDAPDPSQAGPYKVATLLYGSGTDRRRPDFGSGVDLRTEPVDASALASDAGGFPGWARKRYWGFGTSKLPLNARVWFPEGDGVFPLVLIVHGNHKMENFSDPGYAYLGQLLASRGYIVVSVDENFLNVSWSGDVGGGNNLRGWLLLKHLELWRAWNEQEGNPFRRRVDLFNIALIGHSRGGEAILHAAAFNKLKHYPDNARISLDFGFAIKTLIAVAPIDGQYEPVGRPVPVENVNYLVLQGSHDADVNFFAGARTYRRIVFNDGNYRMKAALYIHRANHGQFNTVWGRDDAGPPLNYVLARGALMTQDQQQQIAKVYISAFLDATLRGKTEYDPIFRDHRCARQWLPDTIYFTRFEDSRFKPVSTFDESIDVTKTTVAGGSQAGENLGLWRHQELKGARRLAIP